VPRSARRQKRRPRLATVEVKTLEERRKVDERMGSRLLATALAVCDRKTRRAAARADGEAGAAKPIRRHVPNGQHSARQANSKRGCSAAATPASASG
jgi:hypothetical protein